MNRHFEDTRYYIKRAGEEAKRGIAAELEPLSDRVEELRRGESEPEPSRVEQLQRDVADMQTTALGGAKTALGGAWEKLATSSDETES